MINNFNEKLNKLPKEIKGILLSETGVRLEKFLEKKYEISYGNSNLGELLCMVYFKEISLEEITEFFVENLKIKDENNLKPFLLNLVGMRILPIENYLKNEDFEYIIYRLGGNIEDYKKFINFTKEAVEKEKRGELVDINEVLGIEKEKDIEIEADNKIEIKFNAKKEKEDSLKIFKSSIKNLLLNSDKDILEDYNLTLLELMTDDVKFKKDLENSLYHNDEKLTVSKFKLIGKIEKPTIGNWLKDFIKRNGTNLFSDVVLTEYITKSENTKKLYKNERILLSKLLQLYRNLKFFPESQKGRREDDWEIIPSEEIKMSAIPDKKILTPPKTTAEKNIEIMKEESKDFKDNSLEKLAINEEIEHEKKIEELRFMATKFAEGSLEKKAIEEELHKMEHDN